ncbi:hypothetical protein K402DRAFT_421681 [Aulographum hederae CBS 113979]|uniref:Integral membrane protein n=1 Tax=Aulographum hederae CBS 113979 TaxID=1176131 RepID=A0A6G1GXQ9_9PEZI|nr:hypothetical protein K402DRAFT_421681 [Aulographum hederae CBS 113979]
MEDNNEDYFTPAQSRTDPSPQTPAATQPRRDPAHLAPQQYESIQPSAGRSPSPRDYQNDGPAITPSASRAVREQRSNPAFGARPSVADRFRESTVRLRRLPSSQQVPARKKSVVRRSQESNEPAAPAEEPAEETTGRRRSFSEPMQRPVNTNQQQMPALPENGVPANPPQRPAGQGRLQSVYRGLRRTTSRVAGGGPGGNGNAPTVNAGPVQQQRNTPGAFPAEYDTNIVDWLDVLDPEVSTLSTLNNVQNSLFLPDLGRLYNRRPTYTLTRRPHTPSSTTSSFSSEPEVDVTGQMPPEETDMPRITIAEPSGTAGEGEEGEEGEKPTGKRKRGDTVSSRLSGKSLKSKASKRRLSISSDLTDSYYAVLPHGVSLENWSEEDKAELNDHVRHMLHSRRSKFKQSMKGFKKYVSKPLGFLVTLYAFLITVFGLFWVLFLIGWISGGSDSRHQYLIHVIDLVLVALFAVVGDGLAPFRTVDTYHMIFIARYAHLTWKVREKHQLPDLGNHNDLPHETVAPNEDIELATKELGPEVSVLTPKQQQKLEHHQKKFARSHTFYKPHETETHYAFSIRLLITVVVLLDMHSILQICLGTVTWSTDYKTRSQVPTTVILCCSITCNIMAGIVISIGDRRSRKTEVVERMARQAMTEHAIKHVERKKAKAEKAERERREEQERIDRGEVDSDDEDPLTKIGRMAKGVLPDVENRLSKARHSTDAGHRDSKDNSGSRSSFDFAKRIGGRHSSDHGERKASRRSGDLRREDTEQSNQSGSSFGHSSTTHGTSKDKQRDRDQEMMDRQFPRAAGGRYDGRSDTRDTESFPAVEEEEPEQERVGSPSIMGRARPPTSGDVEAPYITR